ncbi:MAG TPA: aspartate aminotransferase family protein, partial [Candidatus Dormibacteraeota bacterium]
MTDQDIVAAEHTYLMGTFKRLPVTFVEGRGVTVRDSAGKEYIDLVAGIAVNLLGHSHPAVVQALTEQAGRLIHTSNLYYSEPQVALARRLVELSFPSRVFFANSGAEANEAAIKIARKWGKLNRQGAFEILTTDGSFHGRTLATVTAGGQERYSAPFAPLPPGFRHLPYGDLEAVKQATGAETVAVMVEPVMGEVGVVPPPSGYLEGLRQWCDEQDLLLILDEVQTGLGRTGRWFAHQHHGLTPDVMTLAKGLGGGVPIGACLAAPRADVFEPGDHGSTFGGNPLACSAALAVLKVIEEEGLVGHAAEMGDLLAAGLGELDGVTLVRGRGLMQA